MVPKKSRVLLVEDDPTYRERLASIVEDMGPEVVSLESGAHALRYIDGQNWAWYPSMLITDLVMDGVGGYQLMRLIQERYPRRDIPIIVVSQLSSGDDLAEAEMAGATAYVTKPLRENDFTEVLDKVLSAKAKNKKLTFFTKSLRRKRR